MINHGLKNKKNQETFGTKMDKFSCLMKNLLILWPDPSFLFKNDM